ncbi:hypothetical protein [Lentibacter sp. XHP0401]|jgi:hypothetical protein|uniref:hypothetical protein n=1 Tax=Lentibacter sp. XHP0401 TaxID=2984334 RepID=UPI0021E7CE58|nr:hypothetical protein [Lentibacter sp. XHP0401]MCV2892380.1 hypothetical protein [Lentibacter sp. XHP0401]
MHPLVRPALKGAGFFALVCAALVALWVFVPRGEVKWYPSLWMRLAAVSPMFFSTTLGRAVFAVLKRRMDGRERVVFAGAFCLGVGGVGVLTEAAITYVTFGQADGLGYFEILFQPPSSRYTIGVFASIGFASASVLAAGFVALMSVPVRVLSMEHQSRAAASKAD